MIASRGASLGPAAMAVPRPVDDTNQLSSCDVPADFWLRVRPSCLVTMLCNNMVTAACKALQAGRYGAAADKFDRAVSYLEPSTSEYGADPEMLQWTLARLAWLRASADIANEMHEQRVELL